MARAFIGDIAKQVDLNVKTIRYYEGLGLLSEPQRTETGYRVYSEQDVERLRFIKGAKALGLSLTEIKEILGLWGEGTTPCSHVEHLLKDKVADLDRRIQELVAFRDALTSYMRQVESTNLPSDVPCKHIAGVSKGQWTIAPPEQPLSSEEKFSH